MTESYFNLAQYYDLKGLHKKRDFPNTRGSQDLDGRREYGRWLLVLVVEPSGVISHIDGSSSPGVEVPIITKVDAEIISERN